eukprot:g3441.t1
MAAHNKNKNKKSKSAAAGKAAAENMEYESIMASVVKMLVAFAAFGGAAFYFDGSDAASTLSVVSKDFVWNKMPWYAPYVSVAIYFVIVTYHNNLRSNESLAAAKKRADAPGSCVGICLVAWNYFLCAFSMFMFCGLLMGIYRAIKASGAYSYFCDGGIMWDGNDSVGFHMAIFYLSKYPELLDTAFLVLRGRSVRFLHWYHHITVLLYCAACTMTHYPGTPFSVINAFVHSIMYYYYARTAQGVRPKFARFITQIQLAQMLAGLIFTLTFVFLDHNNSDCDGGSEVKSQNALSFMFLITALMYGSYFFLFAKFYVSRYHNKNK